MVTKKTSNVANEFQNKVSSPSPPPSHLRPLPSPSPFLPPPLLFPRSVLRASTKQGTRYQEAPGTRHQAQGTRHQAQGTSQQAPRKRQQVGVVRRKRLRDWAWLRFRGRGRRGGVSFGLPPQSVTDLEGTLGAGLEPGLGTGCGHVRPPWSSLPPPLPAQPRVNCHKTSKTLLSATVVAVVVDVGGVAVVVVIFVVVPSSHSNTYFLSHVVRQLRRRLPLSPTVWLPPVSKHYRTGPKKGKR